MTYVPKVSSGIDLIDNSWGGMYQGGSYMCFGHASSGRGLLGMLFLQSGMAQEERGLFLSPGRPHDWMIQGSSVGFNLKEARDSGWIRLIWIPSAVDLNQAGAEGGRKVIDQLVAMVHRENPRRLVINDFSPFLRFNTFDQFQTAFVYMMQQLDKMGDTTIMLMMPEAVNKPSRQIIEFMKNNMTGSVHIQLEQGAGSENKRRVTLLPGIGHVNHQVFDHWKIPGLEMAGHMKNHTNNSTSAPRKTVQNTVTPDLIKSGSLAKFSEILPVHGELSVPVFEIESIEKLTIEHEVFCSMLKRLFKERELSFYEPFLLVALRIESEAVELEAGVIFDNLLMAVHELVSDEDHVMEDLERQRIIFVLTNEGPDSTYDIFETLQLQLKEQDIELAEVLPKAVSAVVVSDGRPFDSPEEFLAYALEGE